MSDATLDPNSRNPLTPTQSLEPIAHWTDDLPPELPSRAFAYTGAICSIVLGAMMLFASSQISPFAAPGVKAIIIAMAVSSLALGVLTFTLVPGVVLAAAILTTVWSLVCVTGLVAMPVVSGMAVLVTLVFAAATLMLFLGYGEALRVRRARQATSPAR